MSSLNRLVALRDQTASSHEGDEVEALIEGGAHRRKVRTADCIPSLLDFSLSKQLSILRFLALRLHAGLCGRSHTIRRLHMQDRVQRC